MPAPPPPDSTPPAEPPGRRREELERLSSALNEEKAAWRQHLELASAKAAEAERLKLAQTLHDSLSQSLTAIYLMAKTLEHKLQQSCPAEAGQVAEMSEIIHGAVEELRAITNSLRAAEFGPAAEAASGIAPE